ncbi:MAG: hypothetical protein IJV89_04260 [Lentisphaeria bacterium]|nr:hypothetical protein [Lentisphaeria bacterium]
MIFGAPECVAVCIGSDGSLYGVRCILRRKAVELAAAESVTAGKESLAERLKMLGGKIGLRRDHTLFIASADAGGVFFQTEVPEMPKRELHSALMFEAPRHQLTEGGMQEIAFWAVPSAEEGRMTAFVWTVASAGLAKLWQTMQEVKWQPDAVISPYFAVAALEGDAGKVSLPDFDEGFYWENGSFHPADADEDCNKKVISLLKNVFQIPEALSGKIWKDGFLSCMMAAVCMIQQERNIAGVRSFDLVPPNLRPRRLRSQLRITVFLLVAAGLLYGGRMIGAVSEHYGQYTKLNSSVKSLKSRTTALQRKLRGKEKDLKEKSRILEQNAESHDLLLLLAELSAALPESILASNVRLNESGIDLTLHTNMEEPDLAGALRRFPAFKVGTLQNRKVSDTLTVITLRLRRNQEKK